MYCIYREINYRMYSYFSGIFRIIFFSPFFISKISNLRLSRHYYFLSSFMADILLCSVSHSKFKHKIRLPLLSPVSWFITYLFLILLTSLLLVFSHSTSHPPFPSPWSSSQAFPPPPNSERWCPISSFFLCPFLLFLLLTLLPQPRLLLVVLSCSFYFRSIPFSFLPFILLFI